MDWEKQDENDWLVVNQFTVIEGQHNRRPDLVVFVNGLPLGLLELKNAADESTTIWDAFNQIQTYKEQIPSIFNYNAVVVISDGLEARSGTVSSDKERFMPWRTIEGETVAPPTIPQLEVLLRGVFAKKRFLELVRHFIVFEEDTGGIVQKKMAGYHQFHAVRIAVEETLRAARRRRATRWGNDRGDISRGTNPEARRGTGELAWCGTRRARANLSQWFSMPANWWSIPQWRIRHSWC